MTPSQVSIASRSVILFALEERLNNMPAQPPQGRQPSLAASRALGDFIQRCLVARDYPCPELLVVGEEEWHRLNV